MDLSDASMALIASAIGGVTCGVFTLLATNKTIRDQDAKEQKRDEKEIENLLDALGVEIRTLWGFHMKRIGHLVEALPADRALEFYYPLTQDYFTIYNQNAHLIGRIKDCDVSEAIVTCYNKCKKAVDGFKYNNDLLRDYRAAADSTNRDDKLVAQRHQFLIDYGKIIKEDHFELKSYVERMMGLLAQPS